MSTRRWFLGFLLGTGLVAFGAAAPPAQADSCGQRIQRQEWNLQRDISRFGYWSWQVQNDRNNLDRLRYQCGYGYNGGYNNGGYWGPNGVFRRGDGDNDRDDRQWRNRDWDRDHDRGQHRGWDRDRDRDRGRGHDKDRDHDRDRNRDRH